ncbi:NADPH dehydrogenase [Sugiyamaella lignohabitans]|uniref:NADPH dehydrogenase n=1 Tax=Sugiyamaella lignohabitans TaxID=796027 RepID=A0A161HGR1_9ASCO|nr:NADPH dehydrogenase [Sugiyamaella lignohabitans]ANB14980.1 NADPH dehydrogenase [Sugiyamaella lignohabitans]
MDQNPQIWRRPPDNLLRSRSQGVWGVAPAAGGMSLSPDSNRDFSAAPFWTPLQQVPAGTLVKVPEGKKTPAVFKPLTIRGVTFQNRVFVAPMCQYSYEDGFISDWTLVAIGSYAVRGAGLSIIEATAVAPEGRISPQDAGLWKDEHIAPFKRVADFVHSQNQKIGVQIAHAGRLASTAAPWTGAKLVPHSEGGFDSVAPSEGKFSPQNSDPRELTIPEIKELVEKFKDAAVRAVKAGIDVIEIHAAHGVSIHTSHMKTCKRHSSTNLAI